MTKDSAGCVFIKLWLPSHLSWPLPYSLSFSWTKIEWTKEARIAMFLEPFRINYGLTPQVHTALLLHSSTSVSICFRGSLREQILHPFFHTISINWTLLSSYPRYIEIVFLRATKCSVCFMKPIFPHHTVSKNRKNESKMVVAKRQMEKLAKMEQKKFHRLEWEPQGKQTCPLLGSPNLHRAGSERRRQNI